MKTRGRFRLSKQANKTRSSGVHPGRRKWVGFGHARELRVGGEGVDSLRAGYSRFSVVAGLLSEEIMEHISHRGRSLLLPYERFLSKMESQFRCLLFRAMGSRVQ